jgi:hypothetical protein
VTLQLPQARTLDVINPATETVAAKAAATLVTGGPGRPSAVSDARKR